jgi:hypothetical protein
MFYHQIFHTIIKNHADCIGDIVPPCFGLFRPVTFHSKSLSSNKNRMDTVTKVLLNTVAIFTILLVTTLVAIGAFFVWAVKITFSHALICHTFIVLYNDQRKNLVLIILFQL